MPGATTARLVVCDFEMPMKLFMMPHTVPNRPTKGAIAPMVASTPVPRIMARPPFASMRSSRDATRSLMPSRSIVSPERRSSAAAAATSRPPGLVLRASSADAASRSRTDASVFRTLRTRRLAPISSIDFASHTVQVATEATTSAISTPFTSGSAV